MILHLGRETAVRRRDIVGIFNLETSTISAHTRRFLADAQKGGRVADVCAEEMPASFVVCEEGRQGETVYVSPIASATLKKRAGILVGSG